MNRIFSMILSFFDELIPYIRPSNRKGFASTLILAGSNAIPVIGVVFFNWNPFIILVIYWFESAIIGFFNILKMFIGGIIQNGKFSPAGAGKAAFFCIFFTIHYGGFMMGHAVFIVVMLCVAASDFSTMETNPLGIIHTLIPSEWTWREFLESELFAISVLFVSHLISFYMNFIRTKEYNITEPEDYMTQPYKRIVVMHLTILFGFFTVFISGLRGAGVIIIWVGLKVIADLKMNMKDEAERNKRTEAN